MEALRASLQKTLARHRPAGAGARRASEPKRAAQPAAPAKRAARK